MKSKFLYILLLLSSLCATAQTTFIDTAHTYQGSICREQSSSKIIMYARHSQYKGYFVTNGLTSFTHAPANFLNEYSVEDFTIFNDTIFITGITRAGNGYYGWTKIAGSSTQAWDFNVYQIPPTSNMRRIKVFRDGSSLHVLLVGDYRDNTGIYGAIFDIKDFDTCNVAYHGMEYFDDVELTNDYVVTVARKETSDSSQRALYTRIAPKTAFSLTSTQFSTCYLGSGIAKAQGAAHLQAVGLNKFVTVYGREYTIYINTQEVNSGVLNLCRHYTIPSAEPVRIRDLAYNSSCSKLVVLHSYDTIGSASIYSCTTPNILTWLETIKPLLYVAGNLVHSISLSSAAALGSSKFFVSGLHNDILTVWRTGTTCDLSLTHSMSYIDRTMSPLVARPEKALFTLHREPVRCDLIDVRATSSCTGNNRDFDPKDE